MQTSVISIRNTSLYGSLLSSAAFACKTAPFESKLQVSLGPIPHLPLVHAKQRDLQQTEKSIWVPALTCGFVHAKQRL